MYPVDNALKEAQKYVADFWPLEGYVTTNPLWFSTENPMESVAKALPNQALYMPPRFYDQAKIDTAHIVAALKENVQSITTEEVGVLLGEIASFKQQAKGNAPHGILYAQQVAEVGYESPLLNIANRLHNMLLAYFTEATEECTLLDYYLQTTSLSSAVTAFMAEEKEPASWIEKILTVLNIPPKHISLYFKEILFHVYGWASLIRFMEMRPDNPWVMKAATHRCLITLWLLEEYALKHQSMQSYKAPEIRPQATLRLPGKGGHRDILISEILQRAYERHFQAQLIEQLEKQSHAAKTKPSAQMVFCIDPRSERMRRHLETASSIETFGFAGFFGFPFKANQNGCPTYQCPGLLDPKESTTILQEQEKLWDQFTHQFNKLLLQTKEAPQAALGLFEAFGFYHAGALLQKTFFPKKAKATHACKIKLPHIPFSEEGQAEKAAGVLQSIGLVDQFASLVVICGHATHVDNNPYEAALNCGACGGNGGVPNALMATKALNDPKVRALLKSTHGIDIPETTRFVAACHWTTADRIDFYVDQSLPLTPQQNNTLQQLKTHSDKAGKAVMDEKRQQPFAAPPIFNSRAQQETAENNWAEMVPELGLANNYAFIVGPRRHTKHLNLKGEVFLHSYDESMDPDHGILASILAAPVIVGHMINAEYYFSTVNPDVFGAGNKTLHNVIPGIGVMEGNVSDLKRGLPQQSVRFQDHILHLPRRLMVVIFGTQKRVLETVAQNTTLQQLIDGKWISLHVIDPTC